MAPGAVRTTLSHFRAEFEEHLQEKRCSAGVCRGLAVPRRSMDISAAMRP
jgi:NADH-quinone oxidoreductase subunit F